MMKYFCSDERRRVAIGPSPLNGIDYLEVMDETVPMGKHLAAQSLRVTFVKNLTPAQIKTLSEGLELSPQCLRIDGGEQIRQVAAVEVKQVDPRTLKVRVNKSGDFSIYTLRLVTGPDDPRPPAGFDPLLAAVDFSFKAGCPATFDCQPETTCPPEVLPQPEISYLAKDYASFRQLMLDRMALLLPDWKERNPADLGVTLVELLAYLGDRLSYQQDAIATEAYLDTARLRTSVRRHARLVDYRMHDGCNARAWVHVQVSADTLLPAGTPLLTKVTGGSAKIDPVSAAYREAMAQSPLVFETVFPAQLFAAHNRLNFYTWGARGCCLPKGATRATLEGAYPSLKAGDVLVFQEGGPNPNPAHRQAVRLSHVYPSVDPLGGRFQDPPSNKHVAVTEIEWQPADALAFPLCISALQDPEQGETDRDPVYIENISVALGNIVLADHGQTLTAAEELGVVPPPLAGQSGANLPARSRFRPRLAQAPLVFAMPAAREPLLTLRYLPAMATALNHRQIPPDLQSWLGRLRRPWLGATQAVQGSAGDWSLNDGQQAFRLRVESAADNGYRYPPDPASQDLWLNAYALDAPAAQTIAGDPRLALPALALASRPPGGAEFDETWQPKHDLLNSAASAHEYVVEMEADGRATLRFGDGQFGSSPASGAAFRAIYRTGGGNGNVGRGALAHIVTTDMLVEAVTNPLPAAGGVEMESIEHVRQTAPFAFHQQERAVTPDDYAAMAMRHPDVQRAAATLRWTGSWYTVFLTVDRAGGLEMDAAFEEELRAFMDPYRMAGHDLEFESPVFVPLEIELHVWLRPGYLREHVEARLLEAFSQKTLPDGRPGFFHPDHFTFGQPVYLSRLYTTAQSVPGVAAVEVTKFQRLGIESTAALDSGKLELGRLEIARLDNDPNHPERGSFKLV